MRKQFQKILKNLVVIFIPTSFQNRIFVQEHNEQPYKVQVTDLKNDGELRQLIESLQEELGTDITVTNVAPEGMTLSTQEAGTIR